MRQLRRSRRVAYYACLLLALFTVAPGWLGQSRAADNPPAGASASKAIDINQATEEELTAIPGIGEATAKRIVEFRQQNGPFGRVEDLLKIKGIGEKSLEKMRPHIKVSKTK